MKKFVKRAEKNSREVPFCGEKRRKKKGKEEEVILDVFSLVALTSGLQLVE
jgi:hypothetical protein